MTVAPKISGHAGLQNVIGCEVQGVVRVHGACEESLVKFRGLVVLVDASQEVGE